MPFSLSSGDDATLAPFGQFRNFVKDFRNTSPLRSESPDSRKLAQKQASASGSPQRHLRERSTTPQYFPTPLHFSDDEDDHTKVVTNRKRPRHQVLDDTDEEDETPSEETGGAEDEEEEEDEDEVDAYVDKDEAVERTQSVSSRLSAVAMEKLVDNVSARFPSASKRLVRSALTRANWSQVAALAILDKELYGASPVQKKPLKRLKQRHVPSDESESDSDAEPENPLAVYRRVREQSRKENQTVKFYNTATATEIQDIAGCTAESAEKLIELRPFKDIDELRETLRAKKGLSVKYETAYVDMMEGYSLVDEIIGDIEELGGELTEILNSWLKLDTQKDTSDDAVLEEDTGMHVVDAAPSDALEGYLVEQPAIISPDITLKNYQMIGINWLLMLYRKKISGILADEMGLGKTAQVISFLGRLHELGNKGPHLIIVPTSTMDNWLREFERFCPTLEVVGYHGTQSERFEMREDMLADDAEEFNVVVTTYNIATGQKDDRSFLKKLKCESVILDEGHMIRNCTSARYKHLMALSAPFRLLLTGTPLQNNLQELISLLMFIMPDMLVAHEEDIRNLFKIKTISGDTSGKASQIQILSRQRVARAKKMMTPFVLRRRKVDVLKDLPKKVQVIDRNPMLPEQQKLYDLILRESKQSYEQALQDKDKKQKSSGSKLDRLKNIVIQLRKAADHPLLFRHIYNDATIRKMSKAIMKEERYWDANEEYIYEDMSVMTDFELNNLCKEHKVRRISKPFILM